MRLSLLPNLRQLWRDPRTVQLGTDPTRAVVLEFSDPVATRILDLLDGSRTEDEVLTQARSTLAVEVPDTLAVLNALWAAGLLVDTHALLPEGLPERARLRLLPEAAALALRPVVTGCDLWHQIPLAGSTNAAGTIRSSSGRLSTPADALRRRATAKVLITGFEALAAPVAVTLAGAGIGHVDPTIDGRGRPGDLLATIARAAPDTRVSPIRAGTATVVVRVGPRPAALPYGRLRRAAVLTVGIRDGTVLVGPLVRPGGSPCGHCLDLHRRDRDPAWPALAAQLATDPGVAETCALTTAIASAAYAAEEVLSYVDGRTPRTDGAAVEIARPGEARRRSWAPHPLCDCRRSKASALSEDSP